MTWMTWRWWYRDTKGAQTTKLRFVVWALGLRCICNASRATVMHSSCVEGRSLTNMSKNAFEGPLWPNDCAEFFASFQLPRRAKTRWADRGSASAEMKSKAAETGRQRWCFSKASFRTRPIKAPAEIGRGDGYWLAAGRRTFTIERSGRGKTCCFWVIYKLF